jgi:hypothetical protein
MMFAREPSAGCSDSISAALDETFRHLEQFNWHCAWQSL